jgi:hypothetical protein
LPQVKHDQVSARQAFYVPYTLVPTYFVPALVTSPEILRRNNEEAAADSAEEPDEIDTRIPEFILSTSGLHQVSIKKKHILGPMPLFIFFNAKTIHLKSLVHNSIAMTS